MSIDLSKLPVGTHLQPFLVVGKHVKDNKVYMQFFKLDETCENFTINDFETGKVWLYDMKGLKKANFITGSVCEIAYRKDENGSNLLYFGCSQYKGMYHDEDIVMALRVKSNAEEAKHRLLKRMKTDTSIEEAMKPLNPLRQLYNETDFYGQRIIETLVLEYLRRGKIGSGRSF